LEPESAPVAEPQPRPSLWARLRSGHSDTQRLLELEQAIEEFPDAPANYVLRGEMYLVQGENALAVMDFEQGLALAAEQFAREDWGLISQVVRDRALKGLEKARRRLAR
ncbi:MAG: hypothetical protein K8L99_08095, partial [Anaerolineae bacterium]|nr:hypothetical protein [Anaerolineae bacterium]